MSITSASEIIRKICFICGQKKKETDLSEKNLLILIYWLIYFHPPSFRRRYSIVTPSLLHRKSIVSMEYRWTSDGAAMEQPRRSSVVKREFQTRRRRGAELSFFASSRLSVKSFWEGKSFFAWKFGGVRYFVYFCRQLVCWQQSICKPLNNKQIWERLYPSLSSLFFHSLQFMRR